MNSLKSLRNLISKLTSDEKNILLKNISSSNNNNELKSVQLVNLLLSEKKYSVTDIQNKIHGKINYNAFNKLQNRLKLKIFETIIFETSILSNKFSKRNKVNIDLRKKLLQADILQLKGLRNEVLSIYNNIINRSKIFELYDLQVQALLSKQRLQLINSRVVSFNKINEEIIYAENCNNALKESNGIYKEIINKINNSTNYISYSEDLENFIMKLENYYDKYKSPTIGFYFYTLRAEMHENKLMYNNAKEDLEKVKQILLNNESAYTENRYGTVLINLANNNIFLYKFELVIKLAIESKKYFKNLPLTLKIVDEILFYSYFYKFDFNNCNNILIYNEISKNEIIKNKFLYFQSCLFFITGNHKAALSALLNYKEIEKDKEGWNINRRILIIISRIELGEYESADLQVQNLDQFIKRISKKKIVSQRHVIILRILTKLIQENFNFSLVYSKRIKYFKLLDSMDELYRWKIKSPELIIFHDWFRFKMKKGELNSLLRV